MKLNKKEFVSKIAKEADCQHSVALKVLSVFQNNLLNILVEEKEVLLLDLGKIKVSHRSARTGINPKTKAPINLPAKDVPKLAASKRLKSLIAKTDGIKLGDFDY